MNVRGSARTLRTTLGCHVLSKGGSCENNQRKNDLHGSPPAETAGAKAGATVVPRRTLVNSGLQSSKAEGRGKSTRYRQSASTGRISLPGYTGPKKTCRATP